jgi:hypothetical protein
MGELQGAHDTLQKEMEDLLIYLAEQDTNRKELKVCPDPDPDPLPRPSPTSLIALKVGECKPFVEKLHWPWLI